MNLSRPQLDKKEEFSDGKYSMYTFSDSTKKYRRLACDHESICLLPFELNESGYIRNLFLQKYDDYLLGGSKFTCITNTFDKDYYDSHFLAVEDCCKDLFGIADINVNDAYFLGTVSHGIPFSKDYRCYAVNITPFLSEGHKVHLSEIEKVKFSKVLNGSFPDSLVLSCSLLLLSYFSE